MEAIVFFYPSNLFRNARSFKNLQNDINLLLTEREGQYSPVRLEQARLVSSLLYGTRLMLYNLLSKESFR